MANEVMQSLFGMSPYDTQKALEQQGMAEDLAYARLDPRQQILFNARQAGRLGASGTNQLFGLVPEPLQRARSIEGALKSVQDQGIDMSDPEVYYPAVAKALSAAGRPQEAAQVIMQMHKVLPGFTTAKAAETRAAQEKVKGAVSERDRELMAKVNLAYARGENVDPMEATQAQTAFFKAYEDSSRYDTYTGQVVPLPGAKWMSKVYPYLMDQAAQLGRLTVVDPTLPRPAPPAAAVITPTAAPAIAADSAPPAGNVAPQGGVATPYTPSPAITGTALQPVQPITPVVNPNVFDPKAPVTLMPPPVITPQEKAKLQAPSLKKPTAPAVPETFNSPNEKARFDAKLAVYNQEYEAWSDQRKDVSEAEKAKALKQHHQEVLAIQQSAESRMLRKEETESAEKIQAMVVKLRKVDSSSKTVLDTIKEAVQLINKHPRMATGIGALASPLPNTPQHQLLQFLTTIKSNVALDSLMELKASSPTGSSGFGAMNIEELKLLLTSMGSLEQTQDPVELVKVLKRVGEHTFNASTYARDDLKEIMKKKGGAK